MANLRSRWDALSHVRQFPLMACLMAGAGMIALGSFMFAGNWIAVGGVALVLLCGLVWRRNKTIESERAALADARRASVETSERLLRRVGADLHDGPAQVIGLALLRLDALRPLLAADHA